MVRIIEEAEKDLSRAINRRRNAVFVEMQQALTSSGMNNKNEYCKSLKFCAHEFRAFGLKISSKQSFRIGWLQIEQILVVYLVSPGLRN
jgi:hypothetical protein